MIIASIYESNDCHSPGGTPAGGRFCSDKPGSTGGYAYDKSSRRVPDYLKDDIRRARRGGFEVYHRQQPEPVRDIRGRIMDPLALSHAQRGQSGFFDKDGWYHLVNGRILISTAGGEFEPHYIDYSQNKFGGARKKKDLTPADLTDPATPEDITSTFRHELGHLLDDNFSGSRGKGTPQSLAREIRAWQYAVAVSPDHTVSQRMVRDGLSSHAYSAFRRDTLRPSYKGPLYDQEETLDRWVQQEAARGFLDEATAKKADAFTARVMKALNNYGALLRKKGHVEPVRVRKPYIPKSTLPIPGPGGRGAI